MKKTNLLLTGLFAALVCGCSDDLQEAGSVKLSDYALKATIGGNQARTSVDASNNVLWSENDAIGVYTSDGKMLKYDIASGVDQVSATFEPADAENTPAEGATIEFAVYPYAYGENTTVIDKVSSSNRINMTFPAELNYTECSNGPMYAGIDNANGVVTFQHMAGLLKIPVADIPENAAYIQVSSIGLTGQFEGIINENTPKLSRKSQEDNGELIKIVLPSNQKIKVANLYIPLTEGNYTRIAVAVYDNNGNKIDERRRTSSFSIECGKIYDMSEIKIIPPTEVTDLNSFKTAISNKASDITVTEAITLDEDVKLAADTKITFLKTPVLGEHKFTEDESSTIASFTLVYPYNTEETTEQTLNIDLQNSKVYLYSTDESNEAYQTWRQATGSLYDNKETLISHTKANISNVSSLVLGNNVFLDELAIKESTVSILGSDHVHIIRLTIDGATVSLDPNIRNGKPYTETNDDGDTIGDEYWWVTTTNDGSLVGMPSNTRASVTAPLGTAAWDGKSKDKPSLKNNIYQIETAAELAWFMSDNPPTAATAGNLPVKMDYTARLINDINLNGHPWVGAVIKNATFNGNNKTIYNLNIEKFVMNQQGTIYSPDACVGLFAAAYEGAKIKNLTLDGVTISNTTGSPKWVGSLVGYSYGAVEYTNCVAKNVNITISGANSYRVGGLIGYIEGYYKDNDPTKVKLTGCEVHDATIAASYSYGGLVGSMFDSATFTDCKTSGITLNLNDNPGWHGYVSNFIGDIANVATGYARTIQIDNCSATDLTDADKARLRFDLVANEQSGTLLSTGAFQGNCPWCGLVEPAKGVVDNTDNFKIMVNETALVHGTDYNVCTNAEQ